MMSMWGERLTGEDPPRSGWWHPMGCGLRRQKGERGRSWVSVGTPLSPLPDLSRCGRAASASKPPLPVRMAASQTPPDLSRCGLSRCGLDSVDCSLSTMIHNKFFIPRLLPVRRLIGATGKIANKKGTCVCTVHQVLFSLRLGTQL